MSPGTRSGAGGAGGTARTGRPVAPAAVAAFGGEPARTRAHVRGRWRSCPVDAVAAHLPAAGRVLDLGCGHGVLALHLALTGVDRAVTGVDPDAAKLAAGRRAAAGARASLDLREGAAPAVPDGPWDGIAVVDVLYLLDPAAQRRTVEQAAAALAPGGVLVVKEMAHRPRWKFAWNRAQELLAVRVLRITHGSRTWFPADAELPGWMRAAGLDVVIDEPLDRGYLHPHRLVVARRPAG